MIHEISIKKSEEKYVTQIPKCDFCDKDACVCGKEAIMNTQSNLCDEHFRKMGINGIAKKIILGKPETEKEPLDEDNELPEPSEPSENAESDIKELTEEEVKEIAKKFIQERIYNDKDCLKITRLKNINAIASTLVKTIIQVDDIQPGINIIKGYIATCPSCNRKKTIYSSYLKYCKDVFKKELEKDGESGCIKEGTRGAIHPVGVEMDRINDTGYYCTAIDPNDKSGRPQISNVFFSNEIIPADEKERNNFEIAICSKKIEITALIRPLQTDKKSFVEYFFDVQEYKILERKYQVDYALLSKYKEIPKDSEFFGGYFVPTICKRELSKKISAILLVSPHQISVNGNKFYSTIRNMTLGDPGQSKTKLAREMMKYYENTNVSVIAVENSTQRGLLGRTVKNISTGQWVVRPGEILKRSGSAIFLDGYGKFSQEDYTQMRGVEEENVLEIIKAGMLRVDCILHIQAYGNLLKNLSEYSSKHQASYDLAAKTTDIAGKFSGADRRRYHHIEVVADEDVEKEEINDHLAKGILDTDSNIKENEINKFWNNLREFSWSRKPEDFIFSKDIILKTRDAATELQKKYKSFPLEYGILGKKSFEMLLVQLPAVALLHGSIEGEKVIIKEDHIAWLKDLYVEELKDLGLNSEIEKEDFYIAHARKILENTSKDTINILKAIKESGSRNAVVEKKEYGKRAIWEHLKSVVKYQIQENEFEEDDKKKEKICYYSYTYGSLKMPNPDWEFEERLLKEDFVLDPLTKNDGSMTNMGKILFKLLDKTTEDREDE